MIREKTGRMQRLILYGMPGMLGWDLTGSIGTGLPKSLNELGGPPVQYIQRTKNLMDDVAVKDYQRALEDFPVSFGIARQPLTAYRWATRGLETRGAKEIVDDDFEQIKINKWQAMGKGGGFQPVEVSEAYAKAESRRAIWDWYMSKRNNIVTALTLAQDDPVKTEKLQDDLDKLNERAERNNIKLPKVGAETIRGRRRAITTGQQKMLREEIK